MACVPRAAAVCCWLPVPLEPPASRRPEFLKEYSSSANPCRIYGIAGKGRIVEGLDADFTVVDLKARRVVTRDAVASRCGWSPFEGMELTGWPVATVVGGRMVMRAGQLSGEPAGEPVRFVSAAN